jgi:multidrug transporter EmrE-like cation transporter
MEVFISFIILGFGVGLAMVGDVFVKNSNFKNRRDLYLGSLFYSIVAIPVALSFHYFEFGILFLVWEALTIMLGVLLGSLYFKEKFTLSKCIALLLALGALVLAYR